MKSSEKKNIRHKWEWNCVQSFKWHPICSWLMCKQKAVDCQQRADTTIAIPSMLTESSTRVDETFPLRLYPPNDRISCFLSFSSWVMAGVSQCFMFFFTSTWSLPSGEISTHRNGCCLYLDEWLIVLESDDIFKCHHSVSITTGDTNGRLV